MFDPEQQQWLDQQRQAYEKSISKTLQLKECAVVVVKPDAMKSMADQDITDMLAEAHFITIGSEVRLLEPSDVHLLYGTKDKPASKPSTILPTEISLLSLKFDGSFL